jgi:hypothetical protein
MYVRGGTYIILVRLCVCGLRYPLYIWQKVEKSSISQVIDRKYDSLPGVGW